MEVPEEFCSGKDQHRSLSEICMLGPRECNVRDEALANGFSIISTTALQCAEEKPQAPLGKYDKAFRLMQRNPLTPAEWRWITRFSRAFPDDFITLLISTDGLKGVPDNLLVFRGDMRREPDSEELMEELMTLVASGLAWRPTDKS